MEWAPPAVGNTWRPGPRTPIPEEEPAVLDPRGGLIKAWSASTLDKFDACPYAVFLSKVKKIPEPSNEAMDRGTMIHKLGEDFVTGEIMELPKELLRYEQGFHRLRDNYAQGMVEIEQDWAFDINWSITDWVGKDTWARMKLDVFEREDPSSGKVIDHKTGRKFGNELKHNRQALTYSVGAFMRYPELEFVTTEFWYLDQKDGPLVNHYTRNKLHLIKPRVDERAIRLTSCVDFKPKPSPQNCKYCSYKENACEWAYHD